MNATARPAPLDASYAGTEAEALLVRNGFGIWLHGVPSDAYSRPPWTGDSCVASVSLFRSPDKEDLVAVTFDQDYRSDKLTQKARKRQYRARENGQWKIVYEGPVRAGSVALPESFPGSRG